MVEGIVVICKGANSKGGTTFWDMPYRHMRYGFIDNEVVALEVESCTWEEVCWEGIVVAQGWQNQGVGKVGPQLRDNVCLCLQMKR